MPQLCEHEIALRQVQLRDRLLACELLLHDQWILDRIESLRLVSHIVGLLKDRVHPVWS